MVAGGLSVEVTEALGAFAQEVATSLASRSDLQEGSQSATLLAAALLAEGQARLAALDHTRCPSTASSAFRAAVQRAILGTSVASLQLGGGSRDAAPAVRVHVRGSAMRTERGGIFTIGSAPECDIQIAGDASVLPCQLVVVALLGGAVVMDAWSGNGTEVIARGRDGQEPVRVLGRVCSGAIVVEMSERLVLQAADQERRLRIHGPRALVRDPAELSWRQLWQVLALAVAVALPEEGSSATELTSATPLN
eukprot:CAMPEP_0177331558 /NCGR_PEP_ID=MMETSP0368-20130122/21122_1 /TAXON_ID=447022 ORGANISM="Scrippsiella hangoei-like, Strain SHHI-4" /NCGR_SAMPLE_ID=MMETSP0368 /ASSEMBLY_ACC=CAM_ASM_000363 /LENGTH=250 /DNA_ID=CAMNT_0018791963 /DNA_START=3 /DNA_END=756 /DNA_ORIENTATION=-